MSGRLPHDWFVERLNRLNGWWRLWLVLVVAMICLGVFEGLQHRSTYYPGMRGFWCLMGTIDSEWTFGQGLGDDGVVMFSCVTPGNMFAHIVKRVLPVFAILPLVWVASWVRRGFADSHEVID